MLDSDPPLRSGPRRVLANLVHLLGGKAAAGVLSLIYLVIATRTLGAHGYGILILISSYAVMMGSILAFSGFHGVVRYGAIALADGDHAGFARIVRFMALLELGCGALAIILAAVLVPFVGPRLGWSPDVTDIARIYSFAVLATVRATPQGVVQIAGRFDWLGIHQTVSPTIRLLGALIVWLTGAGLSGFVLAWLVAAVVEWASMWFLGWKAWTMIAGGQPLTGPWRGVIRDHEKFGGFIVLTNFDITLRELAPNLVPLTVGWMLGPTATGVLALAQRATSLLQQPAAMLSNASYAVLADQVAKRHWALFRHTVLRSAAIAGALAVLFVMLMLLFGNQILVLLGGHSFAGGTALVVLVALGRSAALVSTPLAAGLTALGKPQRSMSVALLTNLILYPLLPALLWLIGLNGAGWHGMIQYGVALTLLAWFFVRDTDGEATGFVRTTSGQTD
ncbi:O-antigen/teichoic acid export membrane protein [Sphingobium subterraneum]|uniref:O-antigen/teichoic acid export membrane protein n=2 Tax=Sphingobium subterraneum TaxID=627688 RepID=A0A841J227_9SPHN|nr:O-antigen/teichoic acid export membrane protein [Sphingobium subterraneum]